MEREILNVGEGRDAISVAVADAATAAAVGRLFAPLSSDAPGGEREPALEVRRAGTSYRLLERAREGGVHTRTFRRLPGLLAAVEFALVRRLLEDRRAETHLHASGTVVDLRAVLALGASGGGKSSLALAWSRAGYPLLADDVILVDGDGRVRGLPRLVKVSRPALRAHGLADDDTVAPDPRSSELWWDPAHGGGWAPDRYRPIVIAHVSFQRGSPTRIEPLTRASGLRTLLDHAMETGLSPGESVDRLALIAESATFVSARFGCAREAAAALVARLGGVR